jgi:hypothetical protein
LLSLTCSSGGAVRALSTISTMRFIAGVGSWPSLPPEAYQRRHSGPIVRIGALRGSTLALPV